VCLCERACVRACVRVCVCVCVCVLFEHVYALSMCSDGRRLLAKLASVNSAKLHEEEAANLKDCN
jgi:hypothetical protein